MRPRNTVACLPGLAPIDAPRIAVAVMIDEPSNGKYFGGEVAAPVFSQTVQQTLKVLGVGPRHVGQAADRDPGGRGKFLMLLLHTPF
jgi:cell division protein FtsI/penicillin-binding protein 2